MYWVVAQITGIIGKFLCPVLRRGSLVKGRLAGGYVADRVGPLDMYCVVLLPWGPGYLYLTMAPL